MTLKTIEKPGLAIQGAVSAAAEKGVSLRARDLAAQIGVSEAALLAARCQGGGVQRLQPKFGDLIEALPALGKMMVLTRNEYVVHEKIGAFANIEIDPMHGLVLNHDIDLRLFLRNWESAFAVLEDVEGGQRRSFQFFDATGTAIHKIYLKNDAAAPLFDELVARFIAEDQSIDHPVGQAVAAKFSDPSAVDVASFQEAWRGLQDTHEFVMLLRRYKLQRLDALRMAGPEFAVECAPSVVTHIFEQARDTELPIMVFVGNDGCVQIHTGPVKNLKVMGPWFNVLDDNFNLHLREDAIASAWVVRKPTVDGTVTSLEVYAEDGTLIFQMFGERKPGVAELPAWRTLMEDLAAKTEQAA